MVVWGTQGSSNATAALRDAADLIARSPSPGWTKEDTVWPMENMLHGRLHSKPDSAVTAADMQHYNLLLLGNARENAVVARLQDTLPVKVAADSLTTSDGLTYPFSGRALGLLYYNPESPQRLVYWFAADDGAHIMDAGEVLFRQGWSPAMPDLILAPTGSFAVVAQRCFAPDWSWEEGYAESPLYPEEYCGTVQADAFAAEALRKATDSDFCFMYSPQVDEPRFAPGETRWMDVTCLPYEERAVLFTMTGEELLDADATLQAAPDDRWGNRGRFHPEVTADEIDPQRTYTLVCPVGWELASLCARVQHNPARVELSDMTMAEAMQRAAARATD
jgi:hypothetical protein